MSGRSPRRSGPVVALVRSVVLIVLVICTLYPAAFVVMTSLKSSSEFFTNFWAPAWPPVLGNYSAAWAALAPFLANSLWVTGVSTLGVVAFSCLSAYAFARMSFPGARVLYAALLILLMIPAVLTLIPSFLLVKDLGLVDTREGLILPYIAGGQALSVFILRQFFAGLPSEYFEAARIDGAGELRAFIQIALPLVRPTLVTVAILQILTIWNDYLWPFLVVQDPAKQTLVVGLVQFQGRFSTDWGPLMAGYVIASLPLVVLFSMGIRSFMSGLVEGGVKG
jgi:ABC-type glycerol-3-phosphate transport system permease component